MAKWHRLLALCVVGLAVIETAGAAQEDAPTWGLATSLSGLPSEVRSYLIDSTALADQGGQFNASCVGGSDVPTTRFVIAAVSVSETIVAIEHGGRAYGINTLAFRQENRHWKPMEHGRVAYGVTLMTAKILIDQHRKSTSHLQSH